VDSSAGKDIHRNAEEHKDDNIPIRPDVSSYSYPHFRPSWFSSLHQSKSNNLPCGSYFSCVDTSYVFYEAISSDLYER
jgi:hypothetical protein